MRWTIVAFDHPARGKSVLYKQNVTAKELLDTVREAMTRGANLMSIRGFP